MRITGLTLDGGDGENERPTQVTVRMTIAEAAYIAKIVGQQSGNSANEIMAGGNRLNTEISAALHNSVFNRYWHDGVDDAIREMTR